MGWWPCRATWRCNRKPAVSEKLQNQRLETRVQYSETVLNHSGNSATWVRLIVLQFGLLRVTRLVLL